MTPTTPTDTEETPRRTTEKEASALDEGVEYVRRLRQKIGPERLAADIGTGLDLLPHETVRDLLVEALIRLSEAGQPARAERDRLETD